MSESYKEKPDHREKEAEELQMRAPVPFHPYHIAAIAWIFLPGGSVPRSSADIPNINLYAGSQVLAQLDTVFTALQNNLQNPSVLAQFNSVRNNLQALLLSMNNLWGGADSQTTPALTGRIATLP